MKKSKQVLFDTNVLIYAQDKQSEFYQQAQQAHEHAIAGDIRAFSSLQNVTEFLATITSSKRVSNPLSRSRALAEAQKYLYSGVFEIIHPSNESAELMLKNIRFWQKSSPAHIFDLQLIATMLSNQVGAILTANTKDFFGVAGIEVLDLRDFGTKL